MTDSEVNDLLAHIISLYGPRFGRGLTQKVARRLATSSTEATVQAADGDPYAQAKAALGSCGAILEMDDGKKRVAGVVLSGIANMDPAFVVLWTEGDGLHIRASAKEGLIRQNTAEKAIRIIETALHTNNPM